MSDIPETQIWEVGASRFTAAPSKGARLMSWKHNNGREKRMLIHWPADADWSQAGKIRGGNPILFPFCARSFAEGKIGQWKDPSGTIRPMPMHGIARDADFSIESIDKDGFTAKLNPDDQAREAYPYDYEFRVSYRFRGNGFSVEFTLRNLGTKPLPWCAGHHFYFSLPWHEKQSRSDYIINIPTRKALYHAKDGTLERTHLEQEFSTFDDPALVDRIHFNLASNKIAFGQKTSEEQISILIGDKPIPDHWQSIVTWTENDDSPFYCVEPWMGPPNSPAHGKGMHFVEAGGTGSFLTSVSISAFTD